MSSAGFVTKNTYKALKFEVQDVEQSTIDDHLLSKQILEAKDKLTCYADADLQNKLSAEQLKANLTQTDTIILFDPETYEEIIQAVENECSFSDIKYYRTKNLIYYDSKDFNLKMITTAVAPVKVNTYKDKVTSKEVLFWMDVNAVVELPSLSSVNWATRLYRNFNVDSIKVIKGDLSFGQIFEQMMEGLNENASKVYVGNTLDGTPMTAAEISSLGSSIDSIIVFDPKTFSEVVQVVKNELDGSSIKELRMIQDWVWSDEKAELSITYQGFMPIIHRVDNMGNYLNSGPMFVRRVGRDSL